MKSNSDSTGVVRAREKDDFVSRKLIRPTMPDGQTRVPERTVRPEKVARKVVATEHTHAEDFYFQKQIQAKTMITLMLKSGDSLVGMIEWYDKNCLKINRNGKTGVLIYKSAIRYMYKSSEVKS
ncbi:MAG: hypothetical protein JWO13_3016 [Acidobacteriales bacterium]|nr:hypothetical protein [Terriglobales bacterium]